MEARRSTAPAQRFRVQGSGFRVQAYASLRGESFTLCMHHSWDVDPLLSSPLLPSPNLNTKLETSRHRNSDRPCSTNLRIASTVIVQLCTNLLLCLPKSRWPIGGVCGSPASHDPCNRVTYVLAFQGSHGCALFYKYEARSGSRPFLLV